MVWFKVDDGFYTSRKVLSLPRTVRLPAVGLWTLAGNWSGRELTDGVVPEYVLDELGATPRLRQALVDARLWLDHGSDGIEFSNWAKYQPTRADVEAEREAARERQRRRRRNQRSGQFEGTDSPESRAEVTEVSRRDTVVSHEVSHTTPTRPDPTRPEVSKDTSAKSQPTRIPKDWMPTKQHEEKARNENLNLQAEAENFRLHAETHDRKVVRWNQAFNMWLNKATERQKQGTGYGQKPQRTTKPIIQQWVHY